MAEEKFGNSSSVFSDAGQLAYFIQSTVHQLGGKRF